MDNIETTDTENVAISSEGLNLRGSLQQTFDADDETESLKITPPTESAETVETKSEEAPTDESVESEPVEERPQLVPPADMNAAEKEAYLNPTPQNAHVLQQYMNRRAYEYRSDYQRKMQEVEDLKKQTSGVYDTLKQYENDYAKQGISVADIANRCIARDNAMQSSPVITAF